MSENPVVAYEWADLTFCPSCALRATNVGLMISGIPIQPSMEDAIAAMALAQIERGVSIETPVAAIDPVSPTCQSCNVGLEKEVSA